MARSQHKSPTTLQCLLHSDSLLQGTFTDLPQGQSPANVDEFVNNTQFTGCHFGKVQPINYSWHWSCPSHVTGLTHTIAGTTHSEQILLGPPCSGRPSDFLSIVPDRVDGEDTMAYNSQFEVVWDGQESPAQLAEDTLASLARYALLDLSEPDEKYVVSLTARTDPSGILIEVATDMEAMSLQVVGHEGTSDLESRVVEALQDIVIDISHEGRPQCRAIGHLHPALVVISPGFRRWQCPRDSTAWNCRIGNYHDDGLGNP